MLSEFDCPINKSYILSKLEILQKNSHLFNKVRLFFEDDWFSLFPLYPINQAFLQQLHAECLSKQQNHTKQMIFTFKMFDIPIRIKLLTAWIIESPIIKEINCPKTDLVEKILILPIVIWICTLKNAFF
jgi:hypothetical protein